MDKLDRITIKPGLMDGKPTIRGMRVTVGMIVEQVSSGATVDDLLREFPYLEREDISQALLYAAWLVQGREFDIAS
ncbi:MAG: DUF433 domain-containing protein [Devosia sp.]